MSCSLLPPVPLVVVSTALLLLHPVAMATAGGGWEEEQHGCRGSRLQADESFCSWECLVFTLQWPGGFCQSLNNESLCRIPEDVKGWTIHGLWPQTRTSCRCWPLFPSDIQSMCGQKVVFSDRCRRPPCGALKLGCLLQELQDELEDQWPSLLKTRTSFTFWKEEWEKHGSTAACVEGLNSPLRYFQVCLNLRAQMDIQRLLEAASITPSCDQPYQVEDVKKALVPVVGHLAEVQCVKDEQGRQVWFQVKVPLSRSLITGCTSHAEAGRRFSETPGLDSSASPGHPCPPDTPLYFVPIDHQRPYRPCG